MNAAPTIVAFGAFTFDRTTRTLCRKGERVPIGDRALDLLDALTERPGEVLSRQELESRVWPRTIVEESSLRVHVSALRRALGEGEDGARYIANVPGRGYTFVGTLLEPLQQHVEPGSALRSHEQRHNLPPLPSRPVGRDSVIQALTGMVEARRLVTVVGAGGMGKTTVAIAAAESACDLFADGVKFVDLSPVVEQARVLPMVASALGIKLPSEMGTIHLLRSLTNKRVLIVLDNCEQVIDAAANVAQELIAGSPGIHILATSRESLNVGGECVYRLGPLGLPPLDQPDDHSSPAVQLFVQRAHALDDSFTIRADTASLVHRLCRQLDGMPLAIELAAARVYTLGVHDLVSRLTDSFRVLTRGRRTAAPRHQTLQALLDWSHDLLNETDRIVLRRLAVFSGPFSIETASAVVACDIVGAASVRESVLGLVSKSLVGVDRSLGSPHCRLLVTTRAYAMQKLMASGEWNSVSRRHAERVRVRIEAVEEDIEELDVETLLSKHGLYAVLLDDMRAALDWASSPQGDSRLAISITTAGVALVHQLGVMDEFRPRMETALRQAQSLDPHDPVLELRALSALCRVAGVAAHHHAHSADFLARLRLLVCQTSDRDDKIDAIESLMTYAMGRGDYGDVIDLAREVIRLSVSPNAPSALLLGARLMAQAQHALGRHAEAAKTVEHILAHPSRRTYSKYVGSVPTSVSMRALKARIAWLCGEVDDALCIASECVELARVMTPFALGHALAIGAIPVAMWRGDLAAAGLIAELQDLANKHSLDYWASWARMCETALVLREGGQGVCVPSRLQFTAREAEMASTLHERLATQVALERADAGLAGWSAAETLRAATEQGLSEGTVDPETADLSLRRAMAIALSQTAASWALRAAMSQARLHARDAAGRGHAVGVLDRALARFTQGHATRDHVRARHLLEVLTRQDGTPLAAWV
ncbi:ATP-binding protein [Rubrivivax sp. RP6-9]|uniref:ATP-binding protein n=1 Tax=Rubrivivax sp. RP6-9 TaxID=3415750 RepID=UPI003CC68A30